MVTLSKRMSSTVPPRLRMDLSHSPMPLSRHWWLRTVMLRSPPDISEPKTTAPSGEDETQPSMSTFSVGRPTCRPNQSLPLLSAMPSSLVKKLESRTCEESDLQGITRLSF